MTFFHPFSFIIFLIFVLARIWPSIAFFFGSGGGCSCPVCPPPPPQSACCCSADANANGGGCGGGVCGGGGCGANCGGYGSANCGAIGGYNGGGCDGGSTAQNFGCGNGNCGGAFGAGAAPTGGALPCPSQSSSSSACPSQQNCASANCAPSNSVGCSTQSNGGNCAMPTAECDGSGNAAEGNGCHQQQMAHGGNCVGGPCPPQSPSSQPSSSTSSNCQSIQICPPSHSSAVANSLCQPICAPNSPSPAGAQPSTGAGGTYANGPAHPMPNHPPPIMPNFPPEPVGSPYESNSINTFASGPHPAESAHQQNVGSVVDPSSFTTQQQPQIGPQPIANLPVQPPPPAESDNQSDRESATAEGTGGGYRDTGLNNGGKEGGLSLLSSKLIKVGGQTTTTTLKPSTMDWDLYEERLPDLADYETATNIASGGASMGPKSKVKAFVPTTTSPTAAGTSSTMGATFYTLSRTNSQRVNTPIVWATEKAATGASSTTTAVISSSWMTITTTTTPKTTTTMDLQEKNDLLSEDYSENSFKKVHASVQNRSGQKLGTFGSALSSRTASPLPQNAPMAPEEDPKCSSETLRAIMQENIVLSPTISKQLIFSAGRLAFGQSIDVICSKNKFSYTVVSSKVFCEASNGPVTCFAFLQP